MHQLSKRGQGSLTKKGAVAQKLQFDALWLQRFFEYHFKENRTRFLGGRLWVDNPASHSVLKGIYWAGYYHHNFHESFCESFRSLPEMCQYFAKNQPDLCEQLRAQESFK